MSPPNPPLVEHFGERLRSSKFGHHLTRDKYALPTRAPHQHFGPEYMSAESWQSLAWMFRDEDHRQLSDAYILFQRDQALRNFDLSMTYFEALDPTDFGAALTAVLETSPKLKPVERLSDWSGTSGVYMMVFDRYKQFYVGQSGDISKRIRQHWSKSKAFDRLIDGTPYSSVFPVDAMRALDNTRIFAARAASPATLEARAEAAADSRFSLNRMPGGDASTFLLMLVAANPRARLIGSLFVSATAADYEQAWDDIERLATLPGDDERAVAEELAGMDMTIRQGTREDGSTYLWSRRDLIARAVQRGSLSVERFAAYFIASGESIEWPED